MGIIKRIKTRLKWKMGRRRVQNRRQKDFEQLSKRSLPVIGNFSKVADSNNPALIRQFINDLKLLNRSVKAVAREAKKKDNIVTAEIEKHRIKLNLMIINYLFKLLKQLEGNPKNTR